MIELFDIDRNHLSHRDRIENTRLFWSHCWERDRTTGSTKRDQRGLVPLVTASFNGGREWLRFNRCQSGRASLTRLPFVVSFGPRNPPLLRPREKLRR